jgi:hypothetical protein
MTSYFHTLQDRLLSEDTNWKALSRLPGPRAKFVLARTFNDLSALLAYRFLVELSRTFGKAIEAVDLKQGCISIDTSFSSEYDSSGRSFRELIAEDPRYHEIFRRYSVTSINLNSFSPIGAAQPKKAYVVNSSGVAQPVL